MSRYKCPVCEIEIEAGMICPNCAFETHYIMSDSKIIAEIENDRAIKHRNWWNAQQQKVAKLNDVITAKEREIIAKQEECEKLFKTEKACSFSCYRTKDSLLSL